MVLCVYYLPFKFPADHIEEIVTAVFQYIAMLRQKGPQEWVFQECAVSIYLHSIVFPVSDNVVYTCMMYVFSGLILRNTYLQDLNSIDFRFQDKLKPKNYVTAITRLLHVSLGTCVTKYTLSMILKLMVTGAPCRSFLLVRFYQAVTF